MFTLRNLANKVAAIILVFIMLVYYLFFSNIVSAAEKNNGGDIILTSPMMKITKIDTPSHSRNGESQICDSGVTLTFNKDDEGEYGSTILIETTVDICAVVVKSGRSAGVYYPDEPYYENHLSGYDGDSVTWLPLEAGESYLIDHSILNKHAISHLTFYNCKPEPETTSQITTTTETQTETESTETETGSTETETESTETETESTETETESTETETESTETESETITESETKTETSTESPTTSVPETTTVVVTTTTEQETITSAPEPTTAVETTTSEQETITSAPEPTTAVETTTSEQETITSAPETTTAVETATEAETVTIDPTPVPNGSVTDLTVQEEIQPEETTQIVIDEEDLPLDEPIIEADDQVNNEVDEDIELDIEIPLATIPKTNENLPVRTMAIGSMLVLLGFALKLGKDSR